MHLGDVIMVRVTLITSYRLVPMSRTTNSRGCMVSCSVIDVSSVCEFKGSSRALGGWNNSVRHTHDVLQAHVNFKNNKYPEVYGLVVYGLVYLHIYIYRYIYVYTYIYIYTCIYVYIYIYILARLFSQT